MATYLITGTTRGIGLTLVTKLLQRPHTTIIAGVRDPQSPTAQSLTSLPRAEGSNLITVQIDSLSETDAAAAVQHIQSVHRITHIDTVVANAGWAVAHEPLGAVSPATMRSHFEVNTLGPLILFQAALPLLQHAKEPKFVVTSSALGSATIAPQFTVPLAAYGASKAAVNYLISKAAGEYPGIAFVALHPGLVATEMGEVYSRITGEEPIGVEESVEGYLNVIDKPAAEIKGKFLAYSGEEMPW